MLQEKLQELMQVIMAENAKILLLKEQLSSYVAIKNKEIEETEYRRAKARIESDLLRRLIKEETDAEKADGISDTSNAHSSENGIS